jgi:hypothetical protein
MIYKSSMKIQYKENYKHFASNAQDGEKVAEPKRYHKVLKIYVSNCHGT